MVRIGIQVALGVVMVVAIFVLDGLIDRRRSIKYRHVVLSELMDHLDQFLRRAVMQAVIHIELEGMDSALRVRKWYEPHQAGYDAYVLFDGFGRDDKQAQKFRRELVRGGWPCDFGMAGPWTLWKYRNTLGCRCTNPDEVMTVIKEALPKLYGVPESASFTVFVKGGMENADIQRDGQSSSRASIAATMSGNWGRPYLRGQRRDGRRMVFKIGIAVGRLVSQLREWLFGPRGPGDDLRR
jgi:hypothetical protein